MKNPIYATDQKLLIIGRKGENLAQPIIFNVSDWHSQFGTGGSLALLHKRATDEDAYPCTTTIEGSVLTWKPTSGDTGVVGYGEAELRYSINGVVVKSKIWQTQTLKALDGNATVPSPWQSYVDAVATNANKAEAAADAIENMTVGAETSDTTTVTKTIVDDVVHLQFGLQKGAKGDTGAKGDKGDPTDVRINNQSVVTDGVANIKLYSNSLQYNQSGISIPQTPQNRIDNRSQNTAVTTDRINHAVKAALTDGRHMTLTEDEQATAKEVLGISEGTAVDFTYNTDGDIVKINDKAVTADKNSDGDNLATADAIPANLSDLTDDIGVGTLQSNLNNLTPTESPVVGKVLKVKSVNADGTFVCEWADQPTAPIKGVQVAGTDLTPDADGKVNIPQAAGNTTGCVRVSGANGIGINSSNGLIYTSLASNTDITARTNTFKPIVSSNLNYAVKASLTDAKRIGVNGGGLTSDEMDNACGVLGAVRKRSFELIESIQLTEDVNSVQRSAQPNGTAYNFESIIVQIKTNNASVFTAVTAWLRLNSTHASSEWIYAGTGAVVNSYIRYSTFRYINNNGYIDSGYQSTLNESATATNTIGAYTTIPTNILRVSDIDSLNLYATGSSVFPAGTVINIYAVRK